MAGASPQNLSILHGYFQAGGGTEAALGEDIAKRGPAMEMFLSVTVISLLGVAVAAVLFKAAIHEGPPPAPANDESLLNLPPRFFIDDRVQRARPVVPIEVLLLQIERHVRLEQAAAEAFRDFPTAEALQTLTTSPLVH
jgi:hypothetical protein